jgi:cyclopropane-fatty-acyl-phospholipid synthase
MSSSVIDGQLAVGGKQSMLDGIARRRVFTALEGLSKGRLVLQERDGETKAFGQSQESACLTAYMYVEHLSVYKQLGLNGSIGAGEAYMAGTWHTPDLVKLVRLFALNLDLINGLDRSGPVVTAVIRRVAHGLRRNSREGSKKNIVAHYDLSNEFFGLFLDRSMMYSSAIYPTPDASLEEAASCKIQHICERLNLQADDHLLEIGTGWGSLAIHAALRYGCKVTTTTLSDAQYAYATEQVESQGLSGRVEVLKVDYRELTGTYDKLVSVEMIEAVGHRYYAEYFSQCSKLLNAQGLMLIQAITIADQRYQQALRSVDFIQKYIFPGGCLPSVGVIADHVASATDMQIVGLEDITQDYAYTVRDWRTRFMQRVDEVKALGFDDSFIRMWEFYLAYCEAGFEERVIGTSQVLMAKPACRELPQVAPRQHAAVGL